MSIRGVSFRERGICEGLFNTILAEMRRPLSRIKTYARIENAENVEFKVNSIIGTISLKDPYYEIIVFQKRDDMSDPEALYYYIRNAFAHGSFEVIPTNNGSIYLLESAKDGYVKAQMRLKEATLIQYIRLANLTATEIKALRKQKR